MASRRPGPNTRARIPKGKTLFVKIGRGGRVTERLYPKGKVPPMERLASSSPNKTPGSRGRIVRFFKTNAPGDIIGVSQKPKVQRFICEHRRGRLQAIRELSGFLGSFSVGIAATAIEMGLKKEDVWRAIDEGCGKRK